MCQNQVVTQTGWWYTYPSEKHEFVSLDDEIPNIWKSKKVPNHQPTKVNHSTPILSATTVMTKATKMIIILHFA